MSAFGQMFTNAMDMFRSPNPAPQPAAQQAVNGQAAQPADPAVAMQQVPQPQPAGATGEPGEGAALDQFKDLFAAPTEEQLKAQGRFDPATLFAGMDAAKVSEAVGKMNFAAQITEDQLQAISGGGQQAIQTLQQLLNSTGQATMSQAMLANAEMIKQAMGTVSGTLDTRINAVSRQQQIRQAVHGDNAAFSNPAMAPMVDALSSAFSMKNPQATPQQVKEAVHQYMTTAFGIVNQQGSNAQQRPQVPAGQDFSDW